MNGYAPVTAVEDVTKRLADDSSAEPSWWHYYAELFEHLRLPYDRVTTCRPEVLDAARIVLFPSAPSVDTAEAEAVARWVERGGVVVSVGTGSLGAVFGVTDAGPVAEGRVVVSGAPGWLDQVDTPLFARGGCRLSITGDGAEVAASWQHDASPAVVVVTRGDGAAVFLGADVWQSIVRLQQGDPVESDGVPAADGSADVDDGVLKCDDGIVLSYETDRGLPPVTGEPRAEGRTGLSAVPIFDRPHADLWRRVLVQLLLEGARRAATPLPWIHYWPAGIPAVAHLSVDSDRNSSEDAATTLDLFSEIGVEATWCHVYPGGYEPETVQRIGSEGHEHALHYNAVGDADIASWGWPQLRAQHAWAQALTGSEQVLSNKNHYTRWEGWEEFYQWCVRLGIEIDESRGPSKRGNVGFPFGTCHLARPTTPTYRPDVLMLPLHAQDLAWTTHESVRDVILDQVVEHHGVAHFLFHPVHLHRRAYVRDACRDVVAEARRRGMPWWTAARLNAWERLRRSISLDVRRIGQSAMEIDVTAPAAVEGLTVLLALPGPAAEANVSITGPVAVKHALVERHGRKMHELIADVPEGTTALRIGWPGAGSDSGGGR